MVRELPPVDDMQPDPSFGDRRSAAWTAETIRTDAWGYAARVQRSVLDEMRAALPEDVQAELAPRFTEASYGNGRAAQRALFDALSAAKLDAAGPVNIPLTPEQLEAEVIRRRREELDEAEELLGIDGAGLGGTLGGFARAATDELTLAMLPLGLGGSIGRVAASEALLGAAGELAILPREFRVADELDIPAPTGGDVALRVGAGAVLGGVFGGLMAGAPRAYTYLRDRRVAAAGSRPQGVHPVDHEDDIEAAANSLRNDDPITPQSPRPEPVTPPPAATLDTASDAAIVDAIIGVESAGNPNAANPRSSAVGLGQMIESTWLQLVQRHRPDLMNGRSRGQILALRRDPALSRELTTRLMEDNREVLREAGQPATPSALYLAHFLGSGGAVRALRAPLDAPIAALMSGPAIAANRGVVWRGKALRNFTAADLRGWAQDKMAGARTSGADLDSIPTGPTSRGYTSGGQVTNGSGMTIDVEYEVVDASALQQASGDLQPRDRSRSASDEQVAEIAARLDPARLMPSPEADRGAPIVARDNIVESGNGRVMALRRAAQLHPDRFAAYRQAIKQAGFEIPEGTQTPILVARRTSDLTASQRRNWVVGSNASLTARMNDAEQAKSDATALSNDTLALYDPAAKLDARVNQSFVQRFLEALPQTERNAMSDGAGGLTAGGKTRIRNALFARAYDAPDIVARFAEQDVGAFRSLIEALEDLAPEIAALRADIEAGRLRPEMDITPYVLDAMRLIAQARDLAAREDINVGAAITEMLNSPDMLEGAVSPLTAALVRKFWQNGRVASKDKVADFLRRYVAEARSFGGAADDLLGAAPGPLDALRAIDPDTFGDVTEMGRPVPRADRAAAVVGQNTPTGFGDGAASPDAQAAAVIGMEDLQNQLSDTLASGRTGLDPDGLADLTFTDEAGLETSLNEYLADLEAQRDALAVVDACTLGGRANG